MDCLISDGNDDGFFGLDPENNVIYLEKQLDRVASSSHTLMVAASNSPTSTAALGESILTVTVNVSILFSSFTLGNNKSVLFFPTEL